MFLVVTTGTAIIPLDDITVSSTNSSTIEANICMKSMKIPKSFADFDTFKASLLAVIDDQGSHGSKSFNTL